MLVTYLIYFLVFSFLGWILDFWYTSIKKKKLASSAYLNIPLCPLYGFGGIALVLLFTYLILPWTTLIAISLIMIISIEYIGGVFCEKFLKVRVWNYSFSKINFKGYIDLKHSFYWLITILFFYFFIFPQTIILQNLINISQELDIIIFSIFILGFIILIYKRNQRTIKLTNDRFHD